MNYKYLLGILLCLLIVGGVQATNTTPYDAYRVLSIHANTTPFTDDMGKTVTNIGTVALNTTSKQLGAGSAWFNGANNLTIPDSADFDMTASDATFSIWVNPTASDITTNNKHIFGTDYDSQDTALYYLAGGEVAIAKFGITQLSTTGAGLTAGNWHQIVVTRTNADSTTKIYIDGIERASDTGAHWTNSANPLTIGFGRYNPTNYYSSGGIDEFNIWKGVAIPITDLYPQPYEVGESTVPRASFTSVNVTSSIATNSTSSGWEGLAPFTMQFDNTSTRPPHTSFVWNYTEILNPYSPVTFNSTAYYNPIYTFTSAGNYSISLNVTGAYGTNISTQTTWVNLTPALPTIADFVGAPTSGYASTDVSFVDFSTGSYLYSWVWDFGDGSTSIIRNPTHTYATAGSFDVSLTVAGINGTSTKTEVGYITMGLAPNPDSASTLSFRQDDNIIRNLTYYNRTIQISNIVNGSWINGTTLFDADHIRIQRILANTTTFKSNTLPLYEINNTTGTITFNATNTSGFVAGNTPLSIIDIEMLYDRYSPGSTSAGWGSGLIGNSTYKVQFPATTLADTPLAYSWTTFSNFTVNNTAPVILEQPVLFIPELNVTANRYLWDFGDGTTFLSHNTTTSHIYTSASGDVDSGYGSMTITLTAYLSENTSVTNTTTRVGYVTPVYNTSYVKADFSGTPTSGSVGLNVQFTDLSVWGTSAAGSGRTYNWSFGDDGYTSIPYSSSINPNHVYAALGTYTVKLTVNNTIANSTETKTNYITIATSALTTWYTQRIVKISPVDSKGIPINNANVSMNFRGSSLPNTDVSWIQSAFGVSETVATQMQDSTYTMSSYSGEAGSVSFMVFPGFLYDVSIQNTTTGLNYHTSLHPSDPEYTIYCPTTDTILNKGNITSTQIVNTSLYVTQPNMSYVTINFIYQDVSTLTTSVKWDVKLIDNNTVMHTKTFPNPGIGIIIDNYTVKNTRGEEWWFGYNATRSARS